MAKYPKSFFIDIDGSLCLHENPETRVDPNHDLILLPGAVEKLWQWHCAGHRIILTTGREEALREATVAQLHRAGLVYDQLVMGLTRGVRILINDRKPDGSITARAYSIKRNEGLWNLRG